MFNGVVHIFIRNITESKDTHLSAKRRRPDANAQEWAAGVRKCGRAWTSRSSAVVVQDIHNFR
jgi:hypothetical protein